MREREMRCTRFRTEACAKTRKGEEVLEREREDRAARTSTALKVAMLQGRCNIRDQIHHAGGFNAPWGDLFLWVARFWDPGVS